MIAIGNDVVLPYFVQLSDVILVVGGHCYAGYDHTSTLS